MVMPLEEIRGEIERLCSLPGVVRAGACLPDRTSITFPRESEAADGFVMRTIWDIFKLLDLQQIPVQRCLWHYENGQIFALLAKDRLALVVVVQGVLTEEAVTAMTGIFEHLCVRMTG
jgi:hypothetical protein